MQASSLKLAVAASAPLSAQSSTPLTRSTSCASFTFYVADPVSSIETRSLPTLARCYPRSFAFYVADPVSSIHPFSFFLLPLLGRFQFRAHRRETDLGRHETRIGVGDGHTLPSSFEKESVPAMRSIEATSSFQPASRNCFRKDSTAAFAFPLPTVNLISSLVCFTSFASAGRVTATFGTLFRSANSAASFASFAAFASAAARSLGASSFILRSSSAISAAL